MGSLDDPRLRYDYKNREFGTVAPDTKREPFRWVSDVSYKNIHRIVTRGYDTTELVEAGYGIGDVIFIDFQARIPLIEEAKMLNYVMILSLEDGLSAPAAMSRIIASGKTYLTQAAGGSILAFGHAYGAYCAFGSMLDKYLAKAEDEGKSLAEIAQVLVAENLNDEALGVSGLMLKDPAAKRMLEMNAFLSEEQARHLTVHGVARNEDGTYSWKFDNYVRLFYPQRYDFAEVREIWGRIECPTLLMRGVESWASDPSVDGRMDAFRNARLENVPEAGHWVHHDRLDEFLRLVREFLAE